MGCIAKSPITYGRRQQQAQQHAGPPRPYAPRTHHFYLPENFFRMVSSVKFRNLLNGTERNAQIRVLCRKPMTLWYKAESPTPAVPSRTAANLLRTTLTNIVSTCMPPRKPVYLRCGRKSRLPGLPFLPRPSNRLLFLVSHS